MTTFGTRLFTWLRGEFVGEDEFGNRYYQERDSVRAADRRRRRWVIYKGEDEASTVPPAWHAWLHHIRAEPPSEKPPVRRPWQKPHIPNLTGTPQAYRPPGDMVGGERPEGMPPAYQPWRPS